MNILNSIISQAKKQPQTPAIIQLQRGKNDDFIEVTRCTYGSLVTEARHLAANLHELAGRNARIGIVMGNTPEWVLSDIALLIAEQEEVPVPLAFSAEQAEWLLQNCDVVLTDIVGAKRLAEWQHHGLQLLAFTHQVSLGHTPFNATPLAWSPENASRDCIIKVIHTSGTTSRPKGVQIRRHGLDALVTSLWERAEDDDYQRYLNLVPLSLLIEQVTALYMPLTSGGAVIMPPEDMPPLGFPGVTAAERLDVVRHSKPSAMTLTPALVEALANKAKSISNPLILCQQLFGREDAPLLAAGGAPVSTEILAELDALRIPVYQGYGLSENSSVATWNSRAENRIGTVGKPLSHVEIKFDHDGELCLRSSSLFAGYSNEDPSSCAIDEDGWLHTGDIATQDADGYISIIGRKKTMIITANGRNISPEWLESSYRTLPGILHVIVFGDGQQFLSGIFVIEDMANSAAIRASIIEFSHKHLNEIDQISEPIFVPHHPDLMEQLFTVTGRPRRSAIAHFIKQLEAITA